MNELPELKVSLVRVDALLPYAKNSKTHSPEQVELIARSIERFGWTNPCLIADGTIIAGHGRVMAATRLGLAKVPCIDISHLSPEDRRAYVIMDNRSAEKGASWDLGLLREELDALTAIGYDLNLTGFSDEDYAELFGVDLDAGLPTDIDPDDAPPAPEEPFTQPGDVWILGTHRVCCGDSTSSQDWERLLGTERADVVWTDPPYRVNQGRKNREQDKWDGGNRSKTGSIENDKMSREAFSEFLDATFASLFFVMKPGAPIYVAHADVEGTTFRNAFEGAGLHLQSCLIWRKNTMVLGRMDWQSIHEPILYGYKKGSAHRWYGGRKNTSVIELGDGSPFTRMPDGRYQIKVGDAVLVVSADAMIEEHPSTVLYEPKPSRSDLHPTQKPVALIERMLKQSARPGDIVVDAFGGSGSTLIAADRLGMSARLMELDPRFVDVIIARWQTLTGRKATNARTGEPFGGDAETDPF